MTDAQAVMATWLNYYTWIYSPDGPEIDNDVIDKPDLLDAAVESWKRKLKQPADTKHWEG